MQSKSLSVTLTLRRGLAVVGLSLGLTCAAFAASTNGVGQTITVEDDVRCLAATGIGLAQMTGPDMEGAVQSASMYFLGRIDGHNLNLSLPEAVAAQLSTMKAEDMRYLLKKCIGLLQSRTAALREVPKYLQEQLAKPK